MIVWFLPGKVGYISEFSFWDQPEKALCFYSTDGISSDYLDYLPIINSTDLGLPYICKNPSQRYQDQCYWVTGEGVCQSGQPEVLGAHFRALLIPESSKFHRLTKKCRSQDNGFYKTSFIQLVFLEFLFNTSSTTLGVFEVSFHDIKLGN